MSGFIVEDPVTGGTVGRVPDADPAEATGAVEAATWAAVGGLARRRAVARRSCSARSRQQSL